ncbi:hypothetical protein EYF80_015421 [Liparis tanakae]|uniref:Uncharacterized protein n=1 Tax=Liparis tanakae TaxID=230148 RepID=A0A4Z2I8Q6_9TELE|nr:hypothetical protein EYF80_015421 [Liparis tanakae]
MYPASVFVAGLSLRIWQQRCTVEVASRRRPVSSATLWRAEEPPVEPTFLTHLCKCCVLIQAQSLVPLGQRTAPQDRDVQGEEKESQEQQQFRRQSHHPFDAAALGSLRCGRSSDSASSRCRDSDLRIRRGRGAATPLRSHFGNQSCKNDGNRIGAGMVE